VPQMTPVELQRALAQMPSRSALVLTFHCLEGRSPGECAALYGIGLPEWEVLFFEAARALANQTEPLADAIRRPLATRLQAELAHPVAEPLPASAAAAALILHREEVHRLRVEAERAAASSPARAREAWLRRLAVAAIIAISLFVWLRERNKPPAPTPSHFPLPPRGVG